MDVAAVLGWLALAVVLNTSVTVLLAALAIRSGLGARRADRGRISTVRARVPSSRRSPTRAALAEPAGSDPLAGAIDAFLGRSDGLFRAGGRPPGQPAALGRPPRRAVVPGAHSAVSMPAHDSAPPAVTPAPAGRSGPPSRPPGVSVHDRPLSEVTWETSRPSRYVPSGPGPADARGDAQDRGDATGDAAPDRAAPDRIGGPAPSGSSVTVPAGRPVSRVSVALSGRGGPGAEAGVGAVARLGPVIGGFIRERTRASDSVAGLTGGRFTVVLPDTSLDGAAALIRRLTQSCDAWLAAEEPPLRLEFGLVDLPPDAIAEAPVTARSSGPERRRAVPQDV